MSTIISPEIVLLTSIQSVLNYIRKDFKDNSSQETKTLLYKILVGNQLQRYNLFTEAKKVIITNEGDPRHLTINLFYNANVKGVPTIHITSPSEQTINNTIGIGEGLRESEFTDPDEDISEDTLSTYRRVFNRRFKASYNLVITSDNTNEIVLLYHFIRSILISLVDHLNFSGLQNIDFGGSDLNQNYNIPAGIYAKSISITFQYDVGAIELADTEMLSDVIFKGTVIDINN